MIQIDMPMPDNCLECRFNTSEFGYCNAMPVEFVGQVSDFEEDGKPEWCPLKAQEPRVMAGAELTDAELIDAIRKAPIILKPNVDAAPVVHGNWIECYERSRHYYCSNCGKVQGIASVVMKYCPECGAKMAEHPWAGRYADQSGAEYADNPTV